MMSVLPQSSAQPQQQSKEMPMFVPVTRTSSQQTFQQFQQYQVQFELSTKEQQKKAILELFHQQIQQLQQIKLEQQQQQQLLYQQKQAAMLSSNGTSIVTNIGQRGIDNKLIRSKSQEDTASARMAKRGTAIPEDDRFRYALNLSKVRSGEDRRTTLMIKNIPNKYTQRLLLQTVEEKYKGAFDFFYLPIDFKNKCNVGYAFINFVDPKSIISFYEEFNNKKWEKFNSEKVCEIAYARLQGKNALIIHFQNSSLMTEDEKCRPILFFSDGPNAGQPEEFPIGPGVKRRRSISSLFAENSDQIIRNPQENSTE